MDKWTTHEDAEERGHQQHAFLVEILAQPQSESGGQPPQQKSAHQAWHSTGRSRISNTLFDLHQWSDTRGLKKNQSSSVCRWSCDVVYRGILYNSSLQAPDGSRQTRSLGRRLVHQDQHGEIIYDPLYPVTKAKTKNCQAWRNTSEERLWTKLLGSHVWQKADMETSHPKSQKKIGDTAQTFRY